MADEKLNLEVILSARTQGLDGMARDASLAQDTIDALNRAVGLSTQVLNAHSGATLKVEKSLGSMGQGASKSVSEFEKYQAEIRKTTRALQDLAAEDVMSGGRNPLQSVTSTGLIDQDESRKILAVKEAEGVTAEQVARQVIDAEDRKIDAVRAAVKTEGDLREARRSEELSRLRTAIQQRANLEEEASRKSLALMGAESIIAKSRRDQELSELRVAIQQRHKILQDAAKEEQRIASVQGGRDYGNLSVNIDAGISARKREASAWSDVVKARMNAAVAADKQAEATQISSVAVQNQTAHLPRLRYALHDVSNQLLVIGGAMTAFSVLAYKSAIDYERAFANVIRTNDSLMNSQVAANRMFREFMDLAGEIPTSFGDLSEIGALAGQLNIPTHALRDFTEAVAMFSATTGESIDSTATAFGRLDALLPGVQGNFQALGSSILNVGINSVATEGEIIKITTQLAGVGSQAGLTYDELIGLSGALASVGIQPELSRGTITRLFGQISRSVTLGGESMQEFAKISGQSADQFASQWASAPMDAVVGILRGLNARGGEAEAALRAVGITSIRDVPAILRLAQTVDTILVPALGDAADGANEATQLAENYGVIAETVAAKLQILSNNFQSLMAVAGDSNGVFAIAIDIINSLLVSVRELMDNPVTAFFVQGAVAATALSGVVLVLLAGVTRAAAGVLAFRTAMGEAGVQATGLRAQLMALTGTIAGVDAASLKASGGMTRLATTMRVANVATLALMAIPLIGWLDQVSAESRGAVVDVETLSKALSQISPDMSDTQVTAVSDVITRSLESLGASAQGASFWETTNIFSQAEGFWRRTMTAAETEYDAGLQRLSMKTSSWLTANTAGENSWLASFLDPSIAQIEQFEEAWIRAWETASSETQKQETLTALDELKAGLSPEEIEAFEYNLRNLYDVIGSGVDQTALLAEQTAAANDEFEALQDTLMQIVDDVFETVNAQAALSGVMMDLGDDYINLGAAAAFSGDSIQSAIKTIVEQSGPASAAAANLQVFYDFILANSSATAADLMLVANAQKLLLAQGGGRQSTPSMLASDFQAFASGAEKARAALVKTNSAVRGTGSAAREAREEVRTLVDYAGDLAKVWGRAFDIRFSGQSTLDTITSSFISIREAADEAAKRIRDLKNDIRGLSSDIDIQEYFLSIAIEYGDTKRAEAIEADLLKMRAELADKTAELQKEQDAASKSLVGNSKGAIENRKTIQDLVKQYQAHIGALASSGMSQQQLAQATARLKADFIAQATQLGYNRAELELYAKGFDDVATAIRLVPRNITVTANADPAVQAFNEMKASADRANSATNSLRDNLGRGFPSPWVDTKPARALAIQGQIANIEAQVAANARIGRYSDALDSRLGQLYQMLRSGNYYSGGFTGRGGMYDPAGIVHRGEYVIPKRDVNQATGLPYADALGRLMGGVQSRGSAPVASSGGSGGVQVVALSAGTLEALKGMSNVTLVLDNKVLANSTSKVFSDQTTVGAY